MSAVAKDFSDQIFPSATAFTNRLTAEKHGAISDCATHNRSAPSWSIRAIRISSTSRRWAIPTAPNEERGVFRSTDGGETWQKILYKDENTGAIALAFDPNNPKVIYADLMVRAARPWENGAWQGPGSGLYKTTDGGNTWRQLTKGLPTFEQGLGRIGIAVAPSDPNTVYATVDAPQLGGIYVPTTPVKRGNVSAPIGAHGPAAATSPRSKSIRATRRSSTLRRSRRIVRPTAAKRSRHSKARPAATITTRFGSIPRIRRSCCLRRTRARSSP